MTKYKEKTVRKYVIATLDNNTQYLRSLHWGKYTFSDIEGCSKFNSLKLANEMINYYRSDTNDVETLLVVVPVEITYEIINEIEQE